MNQSAPFPTLPAPPSGVLIIDDNLDEHLLMQHMLRRHLDEVWPVGALTAEQARTYLTECPATGAPLPRLILLDLYLPRREDGWRVLRYVRGHPLFASIPIVILSHSTDGFDIEQSYRQGANSYITKPNTPNQWSDCFRMLRQYWWRMATLPELNAA